MLTKRDTKDDIPLGKGGLVTKRTVPRVTMIDFVRDTLRLRPDRILIGEVPRPIPCRAITYLPARGHFAVERGRFRRGLVWLLKAPPHYGRACDCR